MNSKKMIKNMFPWMIVSFFITLLIDGLGIIPAYLMAFIIDNISNTHSVYSIVGWILLYIGVPLICGLLNIFYAYFTAIKCRAVSYQINSKIMESLMFQDMLFHNNNTSSDLVSKTSQDTSDYAYLWVCTIPQSVAGIVVSAITFTLLVQMNWVIGLLMLLYVVCLILPAKILGPLVKSNAGKLFGAIIRIRGQLTEAYTGIRMVKTMGLENKMFSRYKEVFMSSNKIFGKAVAIETVTNQGAQAFIRAIFVGIGFIGGAIAVSQGDMTVGALVSLISLLPSYFSGITGMINAGINREKLVGQYEGIFSYINMLHENFENGNKIKDHLFAKELVFDHITFAYPDKPPILNDFCVNIKKSKWLGIEGSSGLGKSTILDLVLQLYKPLNGQILLDGESLTHYDLAWYRSKIAYVPQDPFLFTGTLMENIELFAPTCTKANQQKALKAAQLIDWISSLPMGLETVVGENGVSISGGEKQRFAIALALMSEREILILDEGTSNLDPNLEIKIRDEIAQLVKKEGLTVISVSHRAAFHEKCDTILSVNK